MKQSTDFLKRHSLFIGIILMFLLTWPIDLANSGVLPFRVPEAAAIFVGYGFVFASLMMTGLTLGKAGVVALLKRFLLWRQGWKWYLIAFLLIPAIDFLGISLNALFGRTPIDFSTVLAYKIFGPSANLALLIVPFYLFDSIANGEEIGWRGYVLPRLQGKYSALVSTLILAVIWALWHLPKFLPHWNAVYFAWWMGDVFAKAVLLTWMYNNTKGSLLLVTLFHASFNTAGVLLPIANTVSNSTMSALIVVVLLEVITATMVTIIAGPARLSRTEPMQVQI